MRTLTQNEMNSVTGAGAGLAAGFVLGYMVNSLWNMNSCSEHYILEQQYQEYTVETPAYDKYGNLLGHQVDVYGEYNPVYVKVS